MKAKTFFIFVFLIIAFGLIGGGYGYYKGRSVPSASPSYLLVIEKGQPILDTLLKHVDEHGIKACAISGQGSVENPRIAYYDLKSASYLTQDFKGIYELASINGTVTFSGNKRGTELYAVLGNREHQAFAGHLMGGEVGAALELIVTPVDTIYKR